MPKSSPRTISLISSDAFTHASSALPSRFAKLPGTPALHRPGDLQFAAAERETIADQFERKVLARVLAFVDPGGRGRHRMPGM
jgi:hypothetical protein